MPNFFLKIQSTALIQNVLTNITYNNKRMLGLQLQNGYCTDVELVNNETAEYKSALG